MCALLRKLAGALQAGGDRFECFVPQGQDVELCLQLRKSALGERLKESTEGRYFEGLSDAHDSKSTLIAARDVKNGTIVGTLRMTAASHLSGDARLTEQFSLGHFAGILPRVTVLSRLAVQRDTDPAPVVQALLVHAYGLALKSGEASIACAACEPSLYRLLRSLGFRPLGKVKASPFGGYLLPLFLDLHAYGYFRVVGSPLEETARAVGFPPGEEGRRWYADFIAKNGTIDPGYCAASGGELRVQYSPLTQGVSEEGKSQLLKEAIAIDCRFGDVVMAQSAGGRTMGFVQRGALEVRKGDRLLTVLGEGDVFGEIAFILGTQRTADVVAASDGTKVVLFGLEAIDQLKSKADKMEIWKNLARILANRLAVNNPETYIAPPPATGTTSGPAVRPDLPRPKR